MEDAVTTTECLPQLGFEFHPGRAIRVSFDAPLLSSDGGLLLLRAVDQRTRTTASLAGLLPAERLGPNVQHSYLELVRQRIFQIACGYEDANDATRMRHDPLLRTVIGRTLDEGPLASQPTLSRFENAMTLRDVVRMQREHEKRWVASLPADIEVVVLDIDGTDDKTHGQQELSFFHAHYDSTIYAPLLVFDQDGRLVSARLRPGNKSLAQFAAPMLERLIRLVRNRFAEVPILVRGDAAFATTPMINRLDRLNAELRGVDYLIAVQQNKAVRRGVEPTARLAEEIAKETGRATVLFSSFIYHSESWDRAHFVVVKASHDGRAADARCLITTVDALTPSRTYAWLYTGRGDAENRIKDFKNFLDADRLSCHRFVANAFRLQLHTAAYELMYALREEVVRSIEHQQATSVEERPLRSDSKLATETKPRLARWQFNTLRERLLKVAAYVRQSVRRICIALPRAFACATLFHETAVRVGAFQPT
jgi:hypothetical protein